MSYLEAPVAIISIAQHASPNVIGHMLDSRAQLIACSSVVVMKFSSYRPSNSPMSRSWSEVRGQRSEVRSQRSEVRSQKSEVRSQKSEVRSQKSEVRLELRVLTSD